MTLVVVDGRLCASGCGAVRPVPVSGRGPRRAPSPDDVVEVLVEAGPGAIALAPEPAPGASVGAVLAVARAMGVECVRVPRDPCVGPWVAALSGGLCGRGYGDALRRVQTLAGVVHARLPTAPWASPPVLVPALRPQLLARWAWHAWRPCAHCVGGGHGAASCARCGTPRR